MGVPATTTEATISAIQESLLQLSATLGRMAARQDQMLVDWNKRTPPLVPTTTTTPMFVSSRVGEQTTKPSSSLVFSAGQVVGAGGSHADAAFASAMPTKCSTKNPALCTDSSHGELVFPAGEATHPAATTSSGDRNCTLEDVGWAGVNMQVGYSTHCLTGSVEIAQAVNTELRDTSFPRFDGTNPSLWRAHCLQYFTRFSIHKCMWVVAASLHMDGKAKEWYEAYRLAQVVGAWPEFIADVETHFGAGDLPPLTTTLGAAHPGVDVRGSGDSSPNGMHTTVESTKPISASYEEVLTYVGGVSLFLEPSVPKVVFSAMYHMELEGTVFSTAGGLTPVLGERLGSTNGLCDAALHEYVSGSEEVLTQVGGLSIFLESNQDLSIASVSQVLHGDQPWPPWKCHALYLEVNMPQNAFHSGPNDMSSSYLVLDKWLPWSRSGFSPGDWCSLQPFATELHFLLCLGELWRWHDNKYAQNEKRNPGVCNQLSREELPSELLEQHNSGENISSGSKNSDLCAAWVTGENFLARPSSDFVSFCGDSNGDLVMLSISLPWDPGVFNELGTTVLQSELVKQQTSGQLLITTYPYDSVARCLFTYVVCSNFRRFGMKATCVVCVHLTHLSAVVWSSVENMLTKLSAAGDPCEITFGDILITPGDSLARRLCTWVLDWNQIVKHLQAHHNCALIHEVILLIACKALSWEYNWELEVVTPRKGLLMQLWLAPSLARAALLVDKTVVPILQECYVKLWIMAVNSNEITVGKHLQFAQAVLHRCLGSFVGTVEQGSKIQNMQKIDVQAALFLHMITPLQQRHVGWIFPKPPSLAKQLLHAADVQGVMFLHIIMLQQKLGDWCNPGMTFPMCSSFSGIGTTSTCLVFVLQSIICTLGRPWDPGIVAIREWQVQGDISAEVGAAAAIYDRIDRAIAWGQAMFLGGGTVTTAHVDPLGLGPVLPGGSECTTAYIRDKLQREKGIEEQNRNRVLPFLSRPLPLRWPLSTSGNLRRWPLSTSGGILSSRLDHHRGNGVLHGQCSLLSRRWRHVWASMPRVTLPGLASESFGSSLLLLREDATLRPLSLHGSNDATHFAHQRRWLRHVASRGIRVLDITLVTAHPFELPDCVFNCATLEEMAVSQSTIPSAVRDVVAPKSVCLPRLRKLRIHHMQLTDPSMAEKLNSGCPALEELDLSRCSLGRVFRISSDTVKMLSVTACDYSEIHVSAPNVVSLKLSVTGRVVKLDTMPSLLRASINVSGDGVVNHHAAGGLGFLYALCNAQYLELSRFGLLLKDTLDMVMDEPAIEFCLFSPVNGTMRNEPATEGGPTFTKLKSLYLGEWLVADFYRPLAYFFKRAPGLAILSLDQWKLYEENNGMISGQVYKRDKPAEELNLLSGLSSDLEVLRLRISKGDDAGEYSTLRRILKEKTKPREMEVVWF